MLSAQMTLQERLAKLSFTKGYRIRIYRQIERMMRNNIPVHRALETLWERASEDGRKKTKPAAMILSHWISEYKSTGSLAKSVQGWIPERERMMIEAGELSGNIANTLHDVVFIAQNAGKMRGAVIAGLAYPSFLGLAVIGVLWMFGVRVIPAFAQVLPMERWTGLAAQMAWLSEFVQIWTIPILLIMFAALVTYLVTLPIWTGRMRTMFDRIPPWSLYRMWNGTGFLLSLSALIRAGMPLPKALSRLRFYANRWLGQRIDGALIHLNSGLNLGDALHHSGYGFPDREIVSDLRVYASLSGFEEAIDTIAREWIDLGVERIQAQSKILFFAALLVLAGTISWVAAGFYDLQQQVSTSVML